MKTIDQHLKEMPEAERKLLLYRRFGSKESYPDTYDDTQIAPTKAVAIACGMYWGMGAIKKRIAAIHKRATDGEFDTAS